MCSARLLICWNQKHTHVIVDAAGHSMRVLLQIVYKCAHISRITSSHNHHYNHHQHDRGRCRRVRRWAAAAAAAAGL